VNTFTHAHKHVFWDILDHFSLHITKQHLYDRRQAYPYDAFFFSFLKLNSFSFWKTLNSMQ